jgi:hypothetical protein
VWLLRQGVVVLERWWLVTFDRVAWLLGQEVVVLERWWLVTFGRVAWLLGQGVVVLVNRNYMFCFRASNTACGTSAAVTF